MSAPQPCCLMAFSLGDSHLSVLILQFSAGAWDSPLLLLIPGCASKTLSPGFACLPLLPSSIFHLPLSFEILLSKTSGYLFSVSGLCLSPYCSNHWGHHHFLEHSASLHCLPVHLSLQVWLLSVIMTMIIITTTTPHSSQTVLTACQVLG